MRRQQILLSRNMLEKTLEMIQRGEKNFQVGFAREPTTRRVTAGVKGRHHHQSNVDIANRMAT